MEACTGKLTEDCNQEQRILSVNLKRKGKQMEKETKPQIVLDIEELEERIAPSSANFPPGQFPSGNPAHAPGLSNPNEVPATNPSND